MTRFRSLLPRPQRQVRNSEPRPIVRIPNFLRRHWITCSLAAVVAVSLVAWAIADQPWRTCGRGMTITGELNECVGVTDGAASFLSGLRLQNVLDRIKTENDAVVANGAPFVSIGYIVPLPRDPTVGLGTALRHELEGAYLAQWRANHRDGLGDIPLIRLLVINVGDQAGHQDVVIPRVIERVTDPAERLVAVAGMGQSLDATKQAIRSLSEARIPIVASRLTGDDLSTTGQPVQGLYRIPATNSAEIIVAARALKSTATLLVQDVNRGDAYTNSLAEQFRKEFTTLPATGKLLEPERYDSSLPAVDNTFIQMMSGICMEAPKAIYYAGRGSNLSSFLAALAGRRCQQLPIKLFTGDDGVDLSAELRQQLEVGDQSRIAANLRTNITLRYTGLAHPGEWPDPQQRFLTASTRIFQENCSTCFTRIFPGEALDDGASIAGYDAMLVTISAIRSRVVQQGSTQADPAALTPGAVLQAMFRINRENPVSGASGPISFDEQGKPIDKPIPLLQLNPDGTVEFIGFG